jgi:MYXO-CTERM domain-containing protein
MRAPQLTGVVKKVSGATRGRRNVGAALALVGLLAAAPRVARAHIKMSTPADWLVTDSSGDPQKITPCGVDPTAAASTYPASKMVTTVHTGDKLVVNWTETVPHDGHFRIALAINSRNELLDPAVTASNNDGTPKSVATSTAYPVLADGLFEHTAASVSAGKAYTYTVTIPNTPCTKCTLQLLQFMAEHPADPSYFYHHCADLTILAAAGGTGGSGGASATGGAGGHPTGGSGTGGSATGGNGAGGSATGGSATGGGGATGGSSASGTGGSATGGSGTGGTSASGSGGSSASATGGSSASGTGGSSTSGTGGSSTSGTGGGDGGGSSGGCSYATGGAGSGLIGLGLAGAALIRARRRRRAL